MPIPKEILAVERPKSTVVKFRLGRYLVVKRTSKRVNGKAKPVDLGTIGEIIDGNQYFNFKNKLYSIRRAYSIWSI